MTIQVRVTQPQSVTATVIPPYKINTNVNNVNLQNVNLEDLNNVDEDVNGLEDGYILVYDATNDVWITQPHSDNTNLDGGTY